MDLPAGLPGGGDVLVDLAVGGGMGHPDAFRE